MMVRRYVVKDMPEAVLQIRKELGKDAVILSTKRLTMKKWLGIWRVKRIEVLAAVGDDVPVQVNLPRFSGTPSAVQERSTTSAPTSTMQRPNWPGAMTPIKSDVYEDAVNGAGESEPMDVGSSLVSKQEIQMNPADLSGVTQDLALIKEMLGAALLRKESELNDVFRHLSAQGVDHDRIVKILTELPVDQRGSGHALDTTGDSQTGRSHLEQVLKGYIDDAFAGQPIQPISADTRVVAFVGPTGVGKTTTVAKIAALHVLSGTRRVGLVTTDTFRIAAVEQLRTYANILNVPLEVAYQPSDLPGALARLEHCDLILIDTAGRNYRVDTYLHEVEYMLQSIKVDETYLVLSVTSKPKDLDELAAEFCKLPVDKFLFTKLDETSTYGAILNLLLTYQKPMSYVTTGQNVPDDIEVASLGKVLKMISGGAA